MLLSTGVQTPSDVTLTAEEVVKHFSYMMNEKVKKDAIDRKTQKNMKSSSFMDFVCAVTLTNTNSVNLGRAQL